jgi:ribonuclease J
MTKYFKSKQGHLGEPELKILTLSGTEGVTKNMTVYECRSDIIIVDCGIGFPDPDMHGIDVVIPDFTYLLENRERIRGLIVTHGHEDHLGAIPFLLDELNIPIYANALVQGFIKERLEDKKGKDALKKVSFHMIGPDQPEIQLGSFKISTFNVNHSVPTSLGISINTPQGRVLHMADFKIDWTPVLDDPIDIATISKYGEEGVLCLLSDCLGSTSDGYSKSEKELSDTFHVLFDSAVGRQIIVTTISSNISRMYQIFDAAIKVGRKVVIGGRSFQQSIKVAKGLGMLPFDESLFVDAKNSSGYNQGELIYVAAGCYGQQGSTLDRISRNDHRDIQLEENAMVVFSADPNPPGADVAVERVMDNLILRGAETIYSQIQENLHVSGHGPSGDLTMIASIVKPKFFIPIGGTVTKARAYTNMVSGLGFDRKTVFELLEGESVIFLNDRAKKGPTIQTKNILLENDMSEVSGVVLRDREHLSTEGVFIVVVPVSKETNEIVGGVEVITRGFIYVKESKELMIKSKQMINTILDKEQGKIKNWGKLQNDIEKQVEKYLRKKTGGKPMVIVHALTV